MIKFTKFRIILLVVFSCFIMSCNSPKKVSTAPPKATTAKIKTPKRLDIPKDKEMYKVFKVLKSAGKIIRKYVTYNKFLEISENGVVDPDLFYDIYQIDTDQKGEWFSIRFKTAERSIKRDVRIKKRMLDLPHQSIVIKLRTKKKKQYTLLDSEACGILDFVALVGSKKSIMDQDFELLKRMQKKYKYILGVIKKLY